MQQHTIYTFLLTLMLLTAFRPALAEDNTQTKNNKADIYDNLYEIYQQAAKHRGDSACLQLCDSMRTLARQQGDARAVAMSWAHPMSFFMNQRMEPQFYAMRDSLKKASEAVGLWSFYYFAYSQQSVYLLRQNKVGETLRLGEEAMNKAYADNCQNGIYISHNIMTNCFIVLRLFDQAAKEGELALKAEVGLPDNKFGNALARLLEIMYYQQHWQQMLDYIAQYGDMVENESVRVRIAEYRAVSYHELGNMAEYKRCLAELQTLYDKYGTPGTNTITSLIDGLNQMEAGHYDQARKDFIITGSPSKYYFLSQLYQRSANVDSMAYLMIQLDKEWAGIHNMLYETDVKKYELEMQNQQLELDNRELASKRQHTRILWAIICLTLMLVGIAVLYWNKRRSNQLLKHANHKLQMRTRQQQAAIEAMQKANQASDAKSAFLFNMSHDIRTPMNAILGFSDLLDKHKDDPELVSDYIQKIKTSGDYLLSLINNVLDMARIESGKSELDEQFYDVMNPNNKVTTIFLQLAKDKHITLTDSLIVEHRYVMLDGMKVKQVMVNLLSNAIKYTPEGGHVSYEFKEVPCERPGYATYVSIISDDGIGMSAEFAKTIFEMFTRERTTTESKVVGTGLGMSIVKKLVDMMGGTIDVQTEQGRGSTFTVTLTHPIVEHPEKYLDATPQETDDEIIDLTGKHLLLAEDNNLNAEIAMSVLEEMGITAERAEDGVQCIEMLTAAEAGHYDCILMDVQMPRMNGYDATRHIRLLPDTAKAHIPIIAMTANAFDEDKRNALEAGMNGHLAKPINVADIVKTLSHVLK